MVNNEYQIAWIKDLLNTAKTEQIRITPIGINKWEITIIHNDRQAFIIDGKLER